MPWLLSQALAAGGLAPWGGWQIKAFPKQLCRVRGVTGQDGKPSAVLCKGAGLDPAPRLGAGAGATGVNIPSTQGNSHKF